MAYYHTTLVVFAMMIMLAVAAVTVMAVVMAIGCLRLRGLLAAVYSWQEVPR